jgi:hypothetical protein
LSFLSVVAQRKLTKKVFSYTKHTESVGITFDWTPTTDPEIVAARARVTRCEGKLSEARNHLNRLMAASLESPTKRARTNQ